MEFGISLRSLGEKFLSLSWDLQKLSWRSFRLEVMLLSLFWSTIINSFWQRGGYFSNSDSLPKLEKDKAKTTMDAQKQLLPLFHGLDWP